MLRSLTVVFFLFCQNGRSFEAAITTDLNISPTASRTEEKPLFTQGMVDGWVKSWQSRLGLSEWSVEAKIVRTAELPKNAIANIRWSLSTKKAVIRVLDYKDSYLQAKEIAPDTELSVVHELIHLSMAKLPLDQTHTELEEEAVRRLSVALFNLASPQVSPNESKGKKGKTDELVAANKP